MNERRLLKPHRMHVTCATQHHVEKCRIERLGRMDLHRLLEGDTSPISQWTCGRRLQPSGCGFAASVRLAVLRDGLGEALEEATFIFSILLCLHV